MSAQAFSCFKKYFQLINSNESKLRSEDTVLDFELVGLSSLWKITFEATDHTVVKNSTQYLHSLYEKV